MAHTDLMTRCHAHNKQGSQCGAYALKGQRVCHYHGGKAPNSLEAARRRLNDLVDPAINQLGLLIRDHNSSVRMQAVKDVLDRAGYKPTEKVQSDGRTVIEIEYVETGAGPLELDRSVLELPGGSDK